MKNKRFNINIEKIAEILEKHASRWEVPVVSKIADQTGDPYRILISTLLSLRTKDQVTEKASAKLFKIATAPEKMIRLKPEIIEKAIFPVGFYRTKARRIIEISKILIEKHGGKIPDNLDDLLSLKGVGRKTANLVLIEGFDKDGICVDTHVHEIMNRLGYVETNTPEETEFALRKKLPRTLWKGINKILVSFGQTVCVPVSPFCSRCPVENFCKRKGVKKSR
jgi:endonuclease-3